MHLMIKLLTSLFINNHRVLILGFGKEGKSTYNFIRKNFAYITIGIADLDINISDDILLADDKKTDIYCGENYLVCLKDYNIIIKSPGVKMGNISSSILQKLTSQTDLFLQCYANQIIGVTGTKGKSTTASLIAHAIKADNKKGLLLGNIGVPAFDMINKIDSDTIIVYELSAHQLEFVHSSPHIAVLLNVFPEHLDYFNKLEDYKHAKFNILKFQTKNDILVYHHSLAEKIQKFKEETSNINTHEHQQFVEVYIGDYKFNTKNTALIGNHNMDNISIALEAAKIAGIDIDTAINSLSNFKSLPHRLEFIGMFGGIKFINDSISTIPQSTIAAVKSLKGVDTIILGGYDRGLDYADMVRFLSNSEIRNFYLLGEAGDRIYSYFPKDTDKILMKISSIESAFSTIVKLTKKGGTCLLSPAAASYDQFHNFQHRGEVFSSLATNVG